jgi:peroxiredoxin
MKAASVKNCVLICLLVLACSPIFAATPSKNVVNTPAVATEPVPLAPGVVAPDFTVATDSGKRVKLSSFLGSVVVVDFWATWCAPCEEQMPHTDAIAKVFQSQGVVFLPVCSVDSRDDFNAWTSRHKRYVMQFYFDPACENLVNIGTTLFGSDVLPTQFVIGRNGEVLKSFVGYDDTGDPNERDLADAIKSALKSY